MTRNHLHLSLPPVGKLRGMRRVAVAVAAAGGLLAAGVPAAKANLIVTFTDGTGSYTPVNDPTNAGPDSWSLSTADFAVTIGAVSSNSPGTTSLAKLLSSTLSVQNLTNVSQTFTLLVSTQGFALPSAPPTLVANSHIGGSIVVGNPANTLSFYSCINPGNTSDACGAGAIVTPTGTPNITTASFNNDQYLNITSLAAPYSMGEMLTVTLGAGAEFNFGANTTLSPAPEPGTLSLMGLGLLGLGVAVRRRTRTRTR